MNIVIVGCGNVGATLAEHISNENHRVSVVDKKEKVVENLSDTIDVYGIVGNGTSLNVLEEAGAKNCDLFIAVMESDEMNLLACLIAKNLGAKTLIARVGNPEYGNEIASIKESLGLNMIINPHQASAREMARLLKYPLALDVDQFVRTKVELVSYKLTADSPLCNLHLKDFGAKYSSNILIPVIERDDEVIVPGGDFEMQEGDIVSVFGPMDETKRFFEKIGIPISSAHNAMIVGGGRTCIYLAKTLVAMGIDVKIIEKDEVECDRLTEMLGKATVIQGDATDKALLLEEGIEDVDAFIANTNLDEENIMLALYAKKVSKAKVITKVHRTSYDDIIDSLDIGSVIYPKHIMAERIVKFIRSKNHDEGNNIVSLYQLSDTRVEAIEFKVDEKVPFINKPISEVNIKKGIILGCVNHQGNISIATGSTVIEPGDTVVIITTKKGVHKLSDIVK